MNDFIIEFNRRVIEERNKRKCAACVLNEQKKMPEINEPSSFSFPNQKNSYNYQIENRVD